MISRLAAAVVAVSLLGCSDSTAPRIFPTNASFSADPSMERTEIEETEIFPVPRGCTGEPVQWTLRQEMVLKTTIDAEGGFHGSFHFHDKGSSGVGLVTGAKYQLAQQQIETFNVRGESPINDTAIFLRRFISQGSLPNFRVTNIFHYTIDANGRMTSFKNTFERICD